MGEINLDLEEHELWWMPADALGLFHLNRKYSALLLLLCAVDALARRRYPEWSGQVGKRFTKYLHVRLPRVTGVQNYFINIPKEGNQYRLEEVLYKFLRNPVVHEGARLAMDDGDAVSINWSKNSATVHVAPEEDFAAVSGDWVFDILLTIIRESVGDDVYRRHVIDETREHAKEKVSRYEFRLFAGPLKGCYMTQVNERTADSEKQLEGKEGEGNTANELFFNHRYASEGDEIEVGGHRYRVIDRSKDILSQPGQTWVLIRYDHVPAQ